MAPYTPPPPPETSSKSIAIDLTVGFFIVVLLLCLLCLLYFLRSRANQKRIVERRGTLFRVRGVIRPDTIEVNLSRPPISRLAITPSVVMPEKSITRKPYSDGLYDKAVVCSQLESSPASSTLSFQHSLANASRPRIMSNLNPARCRHSRSSSGFSAYTQNLPSPVLPRLSVLSSIFPSQPKPVHQLFEPSLPDELALTHHGEGLMVLQSFDDGWCLVARDMPVRSSLASRIFAGNGDKADIGLVPAWVFIEPQQGNTVTRPFRSASINALQLVQRPPSSRHAIFSWSHVG